VFAASSRFGLSLHRGRAGLAELRESWEHASSSWGGRFCSQWAWWDAYLSTLEQDPERVRFARITERGSLAAIVPLRPGDATASPVRARRLEIPRHPHMPLTGFAVRPDLDLDTLLSALAEGLAATGVGWDELVLTHLLAEGVFARPPGRWRWQTTIEKITTCDQVHCDRPWDVYVASLSSNFRSNLNKAQHKMAKLGDVRLSVATTLEQALELFPLFQELEASGWKGKAGTAIKQDPRLIGFYRRLLEELVPRGRARLNCLEAGGRTIAAQLCLVDGETLYVLKLAYDEAFAKLAPGNMLLRQVIASRAFAHVNLVGSPPWFAPWRPQPLDVYRITVYNTSARGGIGLCAAHARRLAQRGRQLLGARR
jgi:CelD/BcsL family acetyltransferase involved in cellulose biosynthesis